MKIRDKIINILGGTVPPKGGQKIADTSAIPEPTEQVELSKDNLAKASEDLEKFKQEIEGKSDEEKTSSIKDYLSNHKELLVIAGLQLGAITAQGVNHKKAMEVMESLEKKLAPKNLKALSDNFDSAQIKEFMAQKHDVKEEIEKLQQLGSAGRLYKATPIRGLLKSTATGVLAGLWTVGPLAAAIVGGLFMPEPVQKAMTAFGGVIASGFTNYFGWAHKTLDGDSRESIYHNLTKDGMHFNTKIGPTEALHRLDKHRTVKVQQYKGADFDKAKDLSDLSIIN